MNVDGPSPLLLASLLRAVGRLALPAEAQERWLIDLGTSPSADELALELGDIAPLIPGFVAAGWLTDAQAAATAHLAAHLEAMSGPGEAELWTTSALATDPRWAEARGLAAAALIA